MKSGRRLVLLLGSALLGLPAAGGAEVYRCSRADGSVFFTDKASACGGAKPHEIRESIQQLGTQRAPAVSPAARARGRFEPRAAEAQAEAWRAKQIAAQQQLEQVTRQGESLRGYVTHCNHGRDLFTVQENGLKRAVSCEAIRAELAGLEAREASLREYLSSGLEEECRRAGCQPGWLR